MRTAFTLIELLVVITIIVVLLALLTPALDRVMYQSELTVCGSRLKGISSQVTLYAHNHRRFYPHRRVMNPDASGRAGLPAESALRVWNRWTRPDVLVDVREDVPIDDRPALAGYLDAGAFALLHDPLTGGDIDFTVNDYSIFIDYNLWYGVRFLPLIGGGKGMYKIGDRMEYDGRRYDVLAGDRDVLLPFSTGWQKVWSSHPDDGGVLYHASGKVSGDWYFAWWEANVDHLRGLIDTNYVYADGSVERFVDVKWEDERMTQLPPTPFRDPYEEPRYWMHVPR